MPSLNTAARNHMADAIVSGFGTGTLVILAGATALATHSVPSMSNSGGVVTAGAISPATNSASGRATSATITQSGRTLTLSVGIEGSGAELIVAKRGATPDITDLDYVINGQSTIASLTITYPAS